MRILVVEDEKRMAEVLQSGLEEESYRVSLAYDGISALKMTQEYQFDLVLLDVMLPGVDGWEVARRIRQARMTMPILMLTARNTTSDIVLGLESGADDYLAKPFSFEELVARLRALARRSMSTSPLKLNVADLTLDLVERRACRRTREIFLTPREFRLVEFLMRNHGRVSSRRSILDAVWGSEEIVEENTLDAFVHLVRRKVDEGEPTKLIHTLRGFGYLIEDRSQA
jgi:two-component system, OmpR family, copper resistance phosphate regulon response regulator CusR